MVNFLYTGSISYTKQSNVYKFMETISEIFGFPEEVFSVEKRSKFEMMQNSDDKGEGDFRMLMSAIFYTILLDLVE